MTLREFNALLVAVKIGRGCVSCKWYYKATSRHGLNSPGSERCRRHGTMTIVARDESDMCEKLKDWESRQ